MSWTIIEDEDRGNGMRVVCASPLWRSPLSQKWQNTDAVSDLS